jgi:hypothetical protein
MYRSFPWSWARAVVFAGGILQATGCAGSRPSAPSVSRTRRTVAVEFGLSAAGRAERDAIARLFLTEAARPADIRDMTPVEEWISIGRLYWVADWQAKRSLVVAMFPGEAAPVSLSGPENKDAAARFLARQFGGRYPGVPQTRTIAEFLKAVAVGTGGNIGTPEFLESQRRDLGEWLRGREKDPVVFGRFCTGVQERESGNQWTMQFNVYTGSGGVKSVRGAGTIAPLTITALLVDEILPSGAFYCPLEGGAG